MFSTPETDLPKLARKKMPLRGTPFPKMQSFEGSSSDMILLNGNPNPQVPIIDLTEDLEDGAPTQEEEQALADNLNLNKKPRLERASSLLLPHTPESFDLGSQDTPDQLEALHSNMASSSTQLALTNAEFKSLASQNKQRPLSKGEYERLTFLSNSLNSNELRDRVLCDLCAFLGVYLNDI